MNCILDKSKSGGIRMRIIPIILILLFTVGCKTADVHERHVSKPVTGEYKKDKKTEKTEKEEKATIPEPVIDRQKKIVKKPTKVSSVRTPAKKTSGKSSEKNSEVAVVPEPAMDVDKDLEFVSSRPPIDLAIIPVEITAQNNSPYKSLIFIAAGAFIVLGLLAVFRLIKNSS
jgi:hypothetical protein